MDPAPFFSEIRDAVTGRIDARFASLLKQVERTLAAQKRWKKTAGKAAKSARSAEVALLSEERKLRALLNPRFRKAARPLGIPHDVAESFARAVLLSGHFRDTVGKRDARHILSSLPLATFPHYRVDTPDRVRAEQLFSGLADAFHLGNREREAMREENAWAGRRIALKRKVMKALRRHAGIVRKSDMRPEKIAALFRALFPGSPLRAGEVDVVITDTALYFCIPTWEEMKSSAPFKARRAAERAAVKDFLSMVWRFRFDYFTHFPAFSHFDSRNADRKLLAFLDREAGAPPASIRECLNHAVSLLDRKQVEPYLIHDTWGHVWQDDLTGMRLLYDQMASLQFPLAPERTHVLGGNGARVGKGGKGAGDGKSGLSSLSGNVVSYADLIEVAPGGKVRLDQDTARLFIEEDLKVKVASLFAPVLAELTADILEHKFLTDHPDKGHLLTSSSPFGDRPAKFDFTWNDLSYYLSVLKNPNEVYETDPVQRGAFLTRLEWLLARKTPHAVSTPPGRKRLAKPLRDFLVLYRTIIEDHFQPDLSVRRSGEGTSISAFFQIYANALHIGYAMNRLIVGHIEAPGSRWLPYREILVLFVLKFFERDPRRNFWRIDEAVAAWAMPLLGLLSRLDRPGRLERAGRKSKLSPR